MIGYVLSLFMLQLTLTYLMQVKRAKNARMIFALMVPITIGAFLIGGATYPSFIPLGGLDPYHVVSAFTSLGNLNSDLCSVLTPMILGGTFDISGRGFHV